MLLATLRKGTIRREMRPGERGESRAGRGSKKEKSDLPKLAGGRWLAAGWIQISNGEWVELLLFAQKICPRRLATDFSLFPFTLL